MTTATLIGVRTHPLASPVMGLVALTLLLGACSSGVDTTFGAPLAAQDNRPEDAEAYSEAIRSVAQRCGLSDAETFDLVTSSRDSLADDGNGTGPTARSVLGALLADNGEIAGATVTCDGVLLAPSTTTTRPVPTTPTGGTVDRTAACRPLAEPLPAGAPTFTIPPGPPPTALVTEDLVVGEGPEVAANDTITVNYVGVSCSTGQIFDDSYGRGAPATFTLAGLIEGWQQGIPGMRVGGQRLLVVPPELGYGASGRPPQILGNETLVFLVSVEAIG